MKSYFTLLFSVTILCFYSQNEIVKKQTDGRYILSDNGASYFAKLSLDCTEKQSPHYYFQAIRKKGDKDNPKDIWPSFYGCYDWHSGVHNHWCLVKILKLYPNIPEAKAIREKLELSFNKENILKELDYVRKHEDGLFEFPYGQAWLLKVAEELKKWDDPDAKRWLNNLEPLYKYCAFVQFKVWPLIKKIELSGSHDSPALALSFGYDYATTFGDEKLKKVIVKVSLNYYGGMKNTTILKEPYEYDFMSASLLTADLMRKVMPAKKYVKWVKGFCPDLFISSTVSGPLQIKKTEKHDGYESHWDGYHLNRIWCLNGMLKTLPNGTLDDKTKNNWVLAMNEMWDYAQESIGKENYDIDHWLSSFSVFALIGYE